MERLEEMLEETDELEEEIVEQTKLAKRVAKTTKILMDEFEKEGLDRELAIEFIKLGLGGE